MNNNQICVVGVGNMDCGDDGIGGAVIRRLENIELNDAILILASGEPASLIEILAEYKTVILIDAIDIITGEGTIHRYDASREALPSELFTNYSTHSMGLYDAIEMSRVLDELPEKLIVFGIEGKNFKPGDTMSLGVHNHLDELVTRIRTEISELTTE